MLRMLAFASVPPPLPPLPHPLFFFRHSFYGLLGPCLRHTLLHTEQSLLAHTKWGGQPEQISALGTCPNTNCISVCSTSFRIAARKIVTASAQVASDTPAAFNTSKRSASVI